MRLLLVRHGQTRANVEHLLDTAHPGQPLTEVGHAQAAALVDRLADERVDRIYVSDLVRTQQTAAPLAAARGLDPVVVGGFREIAAGDLELAGLEHWPAYIDVIASWATDLQARMPGGESGAEVLARYDAGIDQVLAESKSTQGAESGAQPEETVVVVSHGAVIRCWCAARADNIAPDFMSAARLDNTAVIALEAVGEAVGDAVGNAVGEAGQRRWHMTSWDGIEPPIVGVM